MGQRKHFVLIGLLFLSFVLFLSKSWGQENETPLLKSFIQEALKKNPQIQAAYEQWQSARYGIEYARALPDLNLMYGYFGQSVETRVGPQKYKYGASQKIPFPGKLSLKADVKSKDAEIARLHYEATKRDITKKVKDLFYELFWIDRSIGIDEEMKSLLEDIEKVAQTKYESNQIQQQDVIKVQVELSDIIKRLLVLRQNREIFKVKLNNVLNRDQNSPIGEVAALDPEVIKLPLEEIIAKAQKAREEGLSSELEVKKARLQQKLARMDMLPDFTFGYEYIQIGSGETTSIDDGKDAWMATVAINIPLWHEKIKRNVQDKTSQLAARQQEEESIWDKIVYEIQQAYLQMKTSQDVLSLYQDALLPQTQQAFDVSQRMFETGKISFLDWLDAERTYLQTRLAYYKSMSDYHKAVAGLQRAAGFDLGGQNEE